MMEMQSICITHEYVSWHFSASFFPDQENVEDGGGSRSETQITKQSLGENLML